VVEHTLNFPERATGKNNPGSFPRPTTGNIKCKCKRVPPINVSFYAINIKL
jgi:hypothetical protein